MLGALQSALLGFLRIWKGSAAFTKTGLLNN